MNNHSADNPWIGFDLDGTIAKQYWPDDGDFHPTRIGDPIEPMVTLAKNLLAQGYTLKIFTARVGPIGPSPNNKGMKLKDIEQAIADWTLKHLGVALEATCTKDYNMILLYDDRAIHVAHNMGRITG